jgi:alpha-D-ribose 1-methylphosphonate 5-triphosphate diphosphatase
MWFNNLRLVLPDRVVEHGALRIEDGLIAEIIDNHEGVSMFSNALNLNGMTVMPGIIDLHGDMLERDIQPRPEARFPVILALHELDKRMAAAGITTAYAAVSFAWQQGNLRSQETAIEIINEINVNRDELLVEFLIHARFEVTNPDTVEILKPMLEKKLVQLVSLNDHTPGQGQYKNIKKYVEWMTRWLGFDPDKVGEQTLTQVENAIETSTAEPRDWDKVREIARLAREHGILVASHDDDTVEKVNMMSEMGVTISEFPVSIEAAQEAKQRGMHTIMGAPNAYRGSSTTGNLGAREAIKAGVADILATDYFPAAMFHSVLLLTQTENMPLYESAKLVSQNAADAMGLHDRGRIEIGRRADLVIFDDNAFPRVHATLRQGTPIYWDAQMARLAHQQDFRFSRSFSASEIQQESTMESVS